jgi:hypothetical protein
MVFEKIIFHFIFAAESTREAGDRIKPRVEAKPQPWVRHKYMVRARETGGRVRDQGAQIRGLSPTSWARAIWCCPTQGYAFGSTLGFMLSPTTWADFD